MSDLIGKKMQLIIKEFGPIKGCDIEITDAMFLIGPQSSGKSTISKMTYYFLHVRDEYVKYLMDAKAIDNRKVVSNFAKILRNTFLEFWGPTPQDPKLYIEFRYGKDVNIKLELDKTGKFINPILSEGLKNRLIKDYKLVSKINDNLKMTSSLFNTVEQFETESVQNNKLKNLINSSRDLFNFDDELLFIPAGRSLLSTLSDQLQYIHPHNLDFPMRSFIERINKTKSLFGKSLNDIISESNAYSEKRVYVTTTKKVVKYINRILKGEYIHDKDGGKLYLNNKKTYTKINFASSGQQESIWILLSLFLVALEQAKVRVFIEEPEAHLFPIAQSDMADLISFLKNNYNSKFIITTHSPYLISAFNNNIYAKEVGVEHEDAVNKIISQDLWLDYSDISGYFVNNGRLEQLCDDSLKMLKTELIDTASDLTNERYDQLHRLEFNIDD